MEINIIGVLHKLKVKSKLGKDVLADLSLAKESTSIGKLTNRRNYNRLNKALEYSINILRDTKFAFKSPFSDNICICVDSYFDFYLKYTFYRFDDAGSIFYVIIGDVWQELLAVYIPDKNIYIPLRQINNEFPKFIRRFDIYVLDNYSLIVDRLKLKNYDLVLLLKSRHFAHHIWNELTFISELIDKKILNNISYIILLEEPLGKLEHIFTEIDETKIIRYHRLRPKSNIAFNEHLRRKRLLLCPVSGFYIKEKLSIQILKNSKNYISNNCVQEIEDVKRRFKNIVWLSFRLGARTITNMVYFYSELIQKIKECDNDTFFIVDGFSYPYSPLKRVNRSHKITVEDEMREFSKISDLFVELNLPFKVLIGKTISLSLSWADVTTFYVCHHGTLQHKLGWFTNVPGIIHSNTAILTSNYSDLPGNWERENISKPLYINPEHVTDVDKPVKLRGKTTSQKSSLNYIINKKGINHIVDKFREIKS